MQSQMPEIGLLGDGHYFHENQAARARGRVPATRELVVHDNYFVPSRVKSDTVQIVRVQHVARL